MNITIDKICAALESKGHPVFKGDKKNYNINNGYIRSSDPTPNVFNDIAYLFWWYKGNLHLLLHKCTTDPGSYYLGSKMGSSLGTAITKEQLWKAKLGSHKGYDSLIQKSEITVIRDFDRDGKLDFNSEKEQTGYFGINQHASMSVGSFDDLLTKNTIYPEKTDINGWSAGCLVRANIYEYVVFISICKMAVANFGNSITTCLINENDL